MRDSKDNGRSWDWSSYAHAGYSMAYMAHDAKQSAARTEYITLLYAVNPAVFHLFLGLNEVSDSTVTPGQLSCFPIFDAIN